jgi:Patatin-like phospholipase
MTDHAISASPARTRRPTWAAALALLLLHSVAACTTVIARSPVPEDQLDSAAPYGITSELGPIREWGDGFDIKRRDALIRSRGDLLRKVYAENIRTGTPVVQTSLALSGGGADGAFGAGLLNGWTARGDRPEFRAVTGISTGAIIAVFAFLGPDYDDKLKEVYTTYKTDQLMTKTIFAALTGGSALTDTRGYRRLIERYIDDTVVKEIAKNYLRGRTLLIGTTNLDASRPVIWDIGAIAASGHPDAGTLIHDIIQASSAIPAAFPPVLIPVETADGRRYDEMHVDGGATQQVMLFTPDFPMLALDRAVGVTFDRTLYVVINNKLKKPYDPVPPRVISIAGTAASSLLGGSGTGDIYKIFAIAQRDKIDLNVMWIPRDFDKEASEPFDPVYMKSLYDLGYKIGLAGDHWSPEPPDYAPWP